MFHRNPGFTFAAIAALTLGIGTNTAIFTVVDAVLLKPLTYPDSDRMVTFLITSPQGNGPIASIPKFHLWEQQTTVFQDVAANARIGPVVWLVRTHTEPHQFISAVTEQLRQASGGFPVARVRSMDEVVVHSTAQESLNMLLLSIFGASASVLASIGIYGLMAYSVQQRTQEMGIRMALGADRARILNLVVWQGIQLAIAGVILGICAAFGLSRLLASVLFGVKSWDPIVFVTVPVILGAVALLAVWLPATRASRLDPMEALRVE